jgi:ABC-type transport system substrate-binding protein
MHGTLRRSLVGILALLIVAAASAPAGAAPEGQMTWGVHISLAPTWFDPAETPGIITPFNGQGPRVEESGLGLIPGHAYSAPYEDVKLKTR